MCGKPGKYCNKLSQSSLIIYGGFGGDQGRGYYSHIRCIPAPHRSTHCQHLEHPKLAAFIMFMSQPMYKDCYWWRDKNCD